MKVAVTIFPVYDLVRRVAGPDADVVLLVPVGRSEVGFAPASREAEEVRGAKLGILVGLGLDEWMQDLMGRAAPNARRLSVGDRVPSLASSRPSPRASNLAAEFSADAGVLSEGSPDPYVWLDPTRAALMVKAIAEEMARADPSRAAGYRRRSEELTRSLEALDRELESRAASWGSRSFIPFRPVFAYLAERYHLEIPASVVGPAGAILSASREREIQEVLRTDGIRGVFREPQLPPEPALHLGEQAGVPVGVLDALGGEGEADSYERLLRFDMDALEKVLKAAPVQPFKGEK